MTKTTDLKELAALFLKLGFTAFGGPAAHIAMMQREVVQKRKWVDEQRFLDLMGAVNLIPGPNSTELAIHIGHDRAGWRGLIVAGLCFILPAVFITAIFAWLYKDYGQLPEIQPFIYGIQPAIIAIILAAIYPLAKKSFKSLPLVMIGLAVLVLALLGFNEILLMFAAGIFAILIAYKKHFHAKRFNAFLPLSLMPVSLQSSDPEINLRLFLIFLKIGAILYGSGYVLFAFLDAELVATGLLTRQQLGDAIAVGQFTPGPVFSSVTFIGYQVSGLKGAIISTFGIFLPSFIFVALLNPLVNKMRNSKLLSAFLDAVNVASVAMIVAVCYAMAKESMTNWHTVIIAFASVLIILKFRNINSAFVVLFGSLTGYLLNIF